MILNNAEIRRENADNKKLILELMKRWLPKLHIGNCFAIDYILTALFIAWYSMMLVMVPAAMVVRWILGSPVSDVFFVVPREFLLSAAVGFGAGVVWRLVRIAFATRKPDWDEFRS